MMDSVSPFLDYYSKVFDFLHHIYRNMLSQNSSPNMNRNSLMLSVALGWLFEIPVIPETMFTNFSERMSCDSELRNSTSALDKMNLVDQHLLYTCCPYRCELSI
ncbi:codanin-1-like [Dendronephthya gigantea]|uniref:codanin-1-like n=1 Tax=Dendronephthya gigantea TaxID=151771 RepID=UPI00106D621B|nr:codanin-1-like [Dendronephthya gigantea]